MRKRKPSTSEAPAAPQTDRARLVTASDVARVAGVSRSAVSRAFTPGASVSARARAAVEAAAEALGYRPNLIARSLITRRSGIVGVAAGPPDNPFYPALMQALSTELQTSGRHILFFSANPGQDADPQLAEILRYQVDAFVLASTTLSSGFAAECRAAGIPVVLLNRVPANHGCSSVTGDNEAGGRAIARHFAATGHRRPAFIAGFEDSSTSRDRERGFLRGLEEAGLPAPQRACGEYNRAAAERAARQLLGQTARRRPDALFVANDQMACAVLGVARHELGLVPGRDVSIIGFDDIPEAAYPEYSLTTWRQPVEDMARAAVRILDAGDSRLQQVKVRGELVLRSSCRLKIGDGERA